MKLVPAAVVSVIYSEQMTSEKNMPTFTASEQCVFNQQGNIKVRLGGSAEVSHLPQYLMGYIEYRRYAVESS